MKAPNSMQSSQGLGERCGSPQSIVKRFPGGFTWSRPQHPVLIGQRALVLVLPLVGTRGSAPVQPPPSLSRHAPHPHLHLPRGSFCCSGFRARSCVDMGGGGKLVLQTPHSEHHPRTVASRNLLKLLGKFLCATHVPKPGAGTQLPVSKMVTTPQRLRTTIREPATQGPCICHGHQPGTAPQGMSVAWLSRLRGWVAVTLGRAHPVSIAGLQGAPSFPAAEVIWPGSSQGGTAGLLLSQGFPRVALPRLWPLPCRSSRAPTIFLSR